MGESSKNPITVLDTHGLLSRGAWRKEAIPGAEGSDPARSFCKALGELGGLYAVFARFLSWRAELVDTGCIAELRNIQVDYPPVPLATAAATVRRELGQEAFELAASLEGPPLWNTFNRTAYLSQIAGRAIVVQVARDPVPAEDFAAFAKSLKAVKHPDIALLVSGPVIAQFEEWMRTAETLTHERHFLDAIGQHRGETAVVYPQPIPDLSTAGVLCWYPAQGRSAADLVQQREWQICPLIAAAMLEQFYSLAFVDADPDLRAMIVDSEGRLHMRYLNNPLAVPAGRISDGIKYTTAVLAGNATVSAQRLIRMVQSRPPLDLESTLMDEFSAVEPELKIHRWFPPSAASFESNWRALARLEPVRPLFLDCFLRNLIAVGYWNSDVAADSPAPVDAIAQAQPGVVQRMLKTEVSLNLNRNSAAEWAMGSSLLTIGAMREMNRLLEEVRDHDLTFGVDTREAPMKEVPRRRLTYGVLLVCLMAVLLTSLVLDGSVPQPWPVVLRAIAIGTLPALFWAVWRIG
ncbi:MAG TPA: hypothetical protein VHC90_22915 [Bryobacteraceae bacterium]|nr:hypothetical protein [Bryobacteraceae bacterium]